MADITSREHRPAPADSDVAALHEMVAALLHALTGLVDVHGDEASEARRRIRSGIATGLARLRAHRNE